MKCSWSGGLVGASAVVAVVSAATAVNPNNPKEGRLCLGWLRARCWCVCVISWFVADDVRFKCVRACRLYDRLCGRLRGGESSAELPWWWLCS